MRLWQLPSLPRDDTLGHYRDLTFYWFSICGACSLTPFITYAFYEGNVALGLTALCIVVVFIVDAVSMHFGRTPPIPPLLVFIPVIATLCIAVVNHGVIGVLWTYPALMLFQFVLSRRLANSLNGVIIIVISTLSWRYLGPDIAARVAMTLVLTLVFANVFLAIVLELQRRLQNHAILDPLTGIYNRRHFEACIEREIIGQKRSGTPISLLLLDIDHFKPINDELGHATGDQVLIKVVDVIRNTIRQTDLLFRIGGEEFVVLLPATNRDTAAFVAEKIRSAVAGARTIANRPVTVSIGLDELRPGEDRGNLLERCDHALYTAKARGRNRVEHAEPLSKPAATSQSLAG